jgi:hypothetical protein
VNTLARKRRIVLCTLAIVVTLVPALAVPATWAADHRWFPLGPPGTVVDALLIDPTAPDTLYAGTTAGVYKSLDGGGEWAPANTGLTNVQVYTLAMDPTTPASLYVSVVQDGVFKSANGGGDWAPINDGLTNNQVYAIGIDPTAPETIYAGTTGAGVFVGRPVWTVYLPDGLRTTSDLD